MLHTIPAGQNFLADKETDMKASIFALCATVAFGSFDYVAPSIASADPVLTCDVTPGGVPTSTTCSTNWAAWNYNVRWQISGLPTGTYTYAWSSNKPGLITPCDDICDLGVISTEATYRNLATVTATNTVTGQQYTLSTRVMILGVCSTPPAGAPGFC